MGAYTVKKYNDLVDSVNDTINDTSKNCFPAGQVPHARNEILKVHHFKDIQDRISDYASAQNSCPEITWEEMAKTWKQKTIDEIQKNLDLLSDCNCCDPDSLPGDGPYAAIVLATGSRQVQGCGQSLPADFHEGFSNFVNATEIIPVGQQIGARGVSNMSVSFGGFMVGNLNQAAYPTTCDGAIADIFLIPAGGLKYPTVFWFSEFNMENSDPCNLTPDDEDNISDFLALPPIQLILNVGYSDPHCCRPTAPLVT